MMSYLYDDMHLKRITEEYGNMVFRLCLIYIKNYTDAEDAYQEVFIKIIEKAPQFNSKEHEKAWLIKVTINHCKNILKKYKNKKLITLDENIFISINNKNEQDIIQNVLTLPINYRNVIYLYYYEGYSTKEISNIIKTKEVTIRSWLKRARDELRKLLGGVINEQDI